MERKLLCFKAAVCKIGMIVPTLHNNKVCVNWICQYLILIRVFDKKLVEILFLIS